VTQTKTRVAGSAFSTISYRGKAIAFLDSFADSGVAPIAQAQAVHPLGSRHPVEIATPRAVSGGTLSLTIRELWNAPVWQQLAGLAGTNDIVEVWEAIAADPTAITCQIIIRPPTGKARGWNYHNCVVTNIDDTERVEISSMTVPRTIQMMYTHRTAIK
jgi:hypothetical protein